MMRSLRLTRLTPRRLVLIVVAFFLVVWFIRYLRFRNLEWEFEESDDLGHVRDPGMKHDKWIVVTTINPPTEALKALNYIPGWKLLVVGDRKTSKTWSLTGAIYLNTAAQKKLGYTVHRLLPYDSYTRKVIGYLYAIEHGAEYIYDTDDDNLPVGGPASFALSMGQMPGLVAKTKNLTLNPYRHFGQSTMWPRGYPLELVGLSDGHDYELCELRVPAIQQGVVSGDPDVDAIFRLTRHHGKDKLDYTFDPGAPPLVLPKGTFSPMNSQNTLFTAKAFWSLLLPTTVSQRATDIYRSYWAQRLLWLLGENVGFFPPSSRQNRNPHSGLMDSKEEAEVYQNAGHLLRFLHGWTCNGVFFFDCVSQLSHDMVTQGYWMHRDAELVDAWITDLATVGYAPPAIKVRDVCVNSDSKTDVIFYGDEQNTTLPHSTHALVPEDLTNHEMIQAAVSRVCGVSADLSYRQAVWQSAVRYDKVVLVAFVRSTDVVPLMEAAHRPHFPHIVYCSATALDTRFFHTLKLSYFRVPDRDTSGAVCVQTAMRLSQRVSGYLYVSDHAWIPGERETLPVKQPDLMWATGDIDVYKTEVEAFCKDGSLACKAVSKSFLETMIKSVPALNGETKFKSELRQCLVKLASVPEFGRQEELLWLTDTVYYLPPRLLSLVQAVDQLFAGSNRPYDFLHPLLLECLELTVEYLQYSPLSDPSTSQESHYVLPYKYSDILVPGTDSVYKTHFCQRFQH